MWQNDNGLVCLLISIIETTSISITCITIPFDPLFKVISEGPKISLEKKIRENSGQIIVYIQNM